MSVTKSNQTQIEMPSRWHLGPLAWIHELGDYEKMKLRCGLMWEYCGRPNMNISVLQFLLFIYLFYLLDKIITVCCNDVIS